jgi:hypothetical protein
MRESAKIENGRLLHLLSKELGFFNAGGYGQTFRSEWRPTLLLRDSPSCINYSESGRPNPCRECPLFLLVPSDKKDKLVPCHYIPLDDRGTTIAELYARGSQESLDRLYRSWLKDTTQKFKKTS